MSERTLPLFVLPGTWGRVDLSTKESLARTVRSLIDRQVGKADALAQLRAELRGRLTLVAEKARDGGAVEFHFSQEIAPGVPFSASIAVFLPDIELSAADTLSPSDLSKQLGKTLVDSGILEDADIAHR